MSLTEIVGAVMCWTDAVSTTAGAIAGTPPRWGGGGRMSMSRTEADIAAMRAAKAAFDPSGYLNPAVLFS